MALTKFITCDTNGMSLDALLKSLEITDLFDGTKGYRVVIRDQNDCDNIRDRDCDNKNDTLEQGFRERIVLDPCGKPAIMLINTAGAS